MKAGQGQTLMDVALLHSGTAEAAWEIALRSGVSLTDAAGSGLDLPAEATDLDTAAELQDIGANPATDGTPRRSTHLPIGQITIGKDTIG